MGPALALGGDELQPAALDALLGRQVERRPASFHHDIVGDGSILGRKSKDKEKNRDWVQRLPACRV